MKSSIFPASIQFIRNGAQQAWTWWLHEILQLLPRRLRGRFFRRIEAKIETDGVRIIIKGGSGDIDAGYLGRTETRLQLNIAKANRRVPVWIVPPRDSVLSRTIQVPQAALGQVKSFIGVEIERLTPFTAVEIFYAWSEQQTSNGTSGNVRLSFVLRSQVAEWSRALEAQGIYPDYIALGDDPMVGATLDDMDAARSARRWLRPSLIAASLFAVCTGLLADWLLLTRERDYWRTMLKAEQQLFTRDQEKEKKLNEVLSVAREALSQQQHSVGAILSSIALALPDTDWLTEFQFRKSGITLRGYSNKTEALLKAIEPLSFDRTVTLQGEPTVDARLQRQRFNLVFKTSE